MAVADLRVEDATLAHAQAAFRTAGSRLGPVVWALKGLDSGSSARPRWRCGSRGTSRQAEDQDRQTRQHRRPPGQAPHDKLTGMPHPRTGRGDAQAHACGARSDASAVLVPLCAGHDVLPDLTSAVPQMVKAAHRGGPLQSGVLG